MMNTALHNTRLCIFCLLSLVAIFALLMLTHPVVHVLTDEVIPVH